MKKVLSLITALVLSLVIFTSASATTIKATGTATTKMTASQWFSDSQTRAWLTIALALDTFPQMSSVDSNAISDFVSRSSWVGLSKSKNQVMVMGTYGSTTILIMLYTPAKGTIDYLTMDVTSNYSYTVIEALVPQIFEAQAATSQYYENDTFEIYSVIQSLTN